MKGTIMDQNNREPRQYRGTKGLSLAIVIGVAIGTVIGKLMDNMNTGLMIGLVIGVCGWTLLFNRRQPPAQAEPDRADGQSPETAQVETDNTDTQKPQ
jgi:F0F1-type ATP synthase assembly protein I